MSTTLPVKVDGAIVTFVAVLDTDEVFTQTWTHTEDDANGLSVATAPDKAALQAYASEFGLLLAYREVKADEVPAEKFDDKAEYVDPATGNPVSKEDAQAAYDAIVAAEDANVKDEPDPKVARK